MHYCDITHYLSEMHFVLHQVCHSLDDCQDICTLYCIGMLFIILDNFSDLQLPSYNHGACTMQLIATHEIAGCSRDTPVAGTCCTMCAQQGHLASRIPSMQANNYLYGPFIQFRPILNHYRPLCEGNFFFQ